MEQIYTLFYKSKEIVFSQGSSIDKLQRIREVDFLDICQEILDKLPKDQQIVIVFDEDIEMYESLYIISFLKNKGYKLNTYDKYQCILFSYINSLWGSTKKEICPIWDEKIFLIMDLETNDINISFLKVSNNPENLVVEQLTQGREYVLVGEIGIKEYLETSRTNDIYEDLAEHYVNLEIKDAIERHYIKNIEMLEDIYIDMIILCGDFWEYPFLMQYIKSKFNLENTEIMPKDKEDREVLKGGLISEKIRQGLIRMPFNKEGIQYFGNTLSIVQMYGDRPLDNRTIILENNDILPREFSSRVKVEKALEYPLVFKLEADNMQNPPKTVCIKIDFPFVYKYDEIIIRGVAKKQEIIWVDYSLEHPKSNSIISGRLLIDK
ncbi:MAG: hypothetical protein GX987_05250 [Tissierellia bacterium]|nr:hypothetical protein [Tissierellia bacterium]